jgi:hypothetical protein
MKTSQELVEDIDEYCYHLVGVVVHSGTVDAGHYYSFIKERNSEKWYRFDDRVIVDFDPVKLPLETFGGDNNDPHPETYRSRNVYMLFYERIKYKTIWKTEDKKLLLKTSVPQDLLKHIQQDNADLLHRRLKSDSTFYKFFQQLISDFTFDPVIKYQETDLPFQAIKAATTLLMELLIPERNEDIYVPLMESLIKHFSSHVPASKWFLNCLCTTHINWFYTYLLESSDSGIRELMRRLIEACITSSSKMEQDHYANYFATLETGTEPLVPFDKWTPEIVERWLTDDLMIKSEIVQKIKQDFPKLDFTSDKNISELVKFGISPTIVKKINQAARLWK